MRYMVRVGPIPENKTKVGARGYSVAVRGRMVIVHYGKIEVTGKVTSRFRWTRPPTRHRYPCSTPKAALVMARELVRKQLLPNPKGRYELLPTGVRIRKPIEVA